MNNKVKFISFFICSFLMNFTLFGNTGNGVGTGFQQSVSLWGKYGDLGQIQKRAIVIPEIRQMIEMCKQQAMEKAQSAKNNSDPSKFKTDQDECFKNNLNMIPPEKGREWVKQIDYDDPDFQSNTLYETNPAYKTLRDYLSKKFAENLYGTIDPSTNHKGKVVDHKTFYDLYESHMGKHVINLLASYCVNADENLSLSTSFDTKAAIRTKNLQKLSEFTQAPQPNQSNGKQPVQNPNQNPTQNQNAGVNHIMSCVGYIPQICNGERSIGFEGNDDVKFSREQACIIMREVKELRRSLLGIKDIKMGMERDQAAINTALTGFSFNDYDGIYGKTKSNWGQKEKDVDELTTLTSNEILNKSGLGNEMAKDYQNFKTQCVEGAGPNCQKLLFNNNEVMQFDQSIKNEFNARTAVLKKRIEGMNPEEVKNYLRKEGRSDAEIQGIIQGASAQGTPIQKVIADQYERERQAIISSMAKKYEDHNMMALQQQGGGAAAGGAQGAQKGKMQQILTELKDRPGEISALTHFNGIIMGYLSATSNGKGGTTPNPRVTYMELNDSAFNPQNRGASGVVQQMLPPLDPSYFQKLQQQTQQNLQYNAGTSGSENVQSSNIDINSINRLLGNYLKPVQPGVQPGTNVNGQNPAAAAGAAAGAAGRK